MLDIVSAINTWAFQAAGAIASQPLNLLMSLLASSYVVVVPLVAIWLYHRKDKNVFSFALAFFGMFVIGDILKMVAQEPRPCSLQPGCESGFSFPSDHAMALTGPYLFLRGYQYLRFLYPIWLLLILFGRVYLGQHYLTDVLSGVVISLVLTYLIYRYGEKINNAFISHLPIRM